MEAYNKDQSKSNRIPLPSIQPAYKQNKSDHRYSPEIKGYESTATTIIRIREINSIEIEDMGPENMSDDENKCDSKESINDLPTTCNTSKNSFQKANLKHPKKLRLPKKNGRDQSSPQRKLKSENGSFIQNLQMEQGSLSPLSSTSQNFKPPPKAMHPPKVSAKCWAIMDSKTGEVISTKKGNKKREIASLTKMMTCLCVCKLLKQFSINPKNVYIQVSKYAASIGGTSANLQRKDILSIWDLMHALMLPSGNDAAVSLAESFGTYIYLKSETCKARTKQDPQHPTKKVRNAVKYFLYLMNKTAVELGLKNTYYANPHGLINTDSFSTATDQAKLTFEVLKWEMTREIVNKREYFCEVEQGDGMARVVRWENTNKLLGRKGWNGVKTGVTTAAGPSLSALYEHEKDNFIVILLSSSSMEIRWIEAMRLVDWAIKHRDQRNILF